MRKKFNDADGTEQEFTAAGEARTHQDEKAESSLIRKQGILVHHDISRSTIHVEDFMCRHRSLRFPPCT